MRIKPAPGTYKLTFEDMVVILHVTEDEAILNVLPWAFRFEWVELEHGPILLTDEDSLLRPGWGIGFDNEGNCVLISPEGVEGEGTYERLP